MQTTNDALTNAFLLLTATVREFEAIGRPCLGATLKPKLRTRHFDDRLFGFRRFGDFLRAAAAAGHVTLATTPGGDLSISSPLPSQPNLGEAPSARSVIPRDEVRLTESLESMGPVRIRQDLWNAFNSFSDKWFYDPTQDIASKYANGIAPAGLIAIPSGGERVKEWMRNFAVLQEPELKARLLSAIENDGAFYQFANVARFNGLQRAWSQFHNRSVVAAIQKWAAMNSVQPQSIVTPFRKTLVAHPLIEARPETRPDSSAIVQEAVNVAQTASPELNSKLESLIDSLINELISLRGLLQVAGPKRT